MLCAADASQQLFYDNPLYWLCGAGLIVILVCAEVIVHEGGHWLMARWRGYVVLGFKVGEGRVIWKRRMASSYWELRLWPTMGCVLAVKRTPVSRLDAFLLSAGGPAGTVAAAAGCFAAWLHFHGTPQDEWRTVLAQAFAIALCLAAVSFLYNVWPHRGRLGQDSVANDGLQMLAALTGAGVPHAGHYQEALRMYASGGPAPAEETEAGWSFYLRTILEGETGDGPALLNCVTEALTSGALQPGERLYFQALLAELALHHPSREMRQQALPAAEELAGQAGATPRARFLLGALCIENGEFLRGRQLLRTLSNDKDAEIRAAAFAWLALADHRQGRRDQARENLHAAFLASSLSPVARKAAAEILGGSEQNLRRGRTAPHSCPPDHAGEAPEGQAPAPLPGFTGGSLRSSSAAAFMP